MKKKGMTLLLVLPLLMTACSSSNKIYKITDLDVIYSNKDSYLTNIDEETIISYLDNKFSFMLYEYGSSCSYCKEAGQSIYAIQKEYHYQIYGYEATNSYYKLNESYPSIFLEIASYPRFYIFSKGKLVSESAGRSTLTSQSFIRRINDYNKGKSIYTFTTKESFDYLKETYDDYFLFTYQSNDKTSIDYLAYACDIYKDITPLVVLNISNIKEEVKEIIIDELQIDETLLNASLSYINKKKIESSLDYLKHKKEDIKSMFSSF